MEKLHLESKLAWLYFSTVTWCVFYPDFLYGKDFFNVLLTVKRYVSTRGLSNHNINRDSHLVVFYPDFLNGKDFFNVLLTVQRYVST